MNYPVKNTKNFIEFLNEIIEGKFDPKELSKQTNDSLYRFKSNCRQDLRILGFVDKQNDINLSLLRDYSETTDKDNFLRERLLTSEYFRIALFCLELLREYRKEEKKSILVELGMLIVQNSRGENLMVDSVAKDRTRNLLNWLESTGLIDEQWCPTENFFETLNKKEPLMTSNIRGSLLKIMNEYLSARREAFGSHPLGTFVRHEIPKEFTGLSFIDASQYLVTGSVGQGNWAAVPWIAIMNHGITESTQRGYYLCYLFSEDMQSVVLTFMQGVTETSKEEMIGIKSEIRESIPTTSKVKMDDDIYLGASKKARDYAFSTAAYFRYEFENMPSENQLVDDLSEMVEIYENYIALKNKKSKYEYEEIKPIKELPGMQVSGKDDTYITYKNLVTHIHTYITSKGFLYKKEDVTNLFLSLKTKPFVILSGISGTGKTKMVQWFAESVGATEENGQFTLIPIRPDWHDGSDLLGYFDIKNEFKEGPLTKVIKKAIDNPAKPYFVLLDEMNLARVEHYFSDILSVMESRKWENGRIVTSNILTEENAGMTLKLPGNLYIIGTVNMDETTHPFSKKVLDRANTIEFNEVDLSNLAFLKETETVEPINIDNNRFAPKYLHLKDAYQDHQELIEKVTDELVKINGTLQIMNAHVGYRVRDEICFYLAYNDEGNLLKFEEALDYCILQKILPRISGSDYRVVRLLQELYRLFTNVQYEEGKGDYEQDLNTAIYPQSARKVLEMLRRQQDDGFTSFWIS